MSRSEASRARLTPALEPTYHPPDDDAPCVLWGTGAFACL